MIYKVLILEDKQTKKQIGTVKDIEPELYALLDKLSELDDDIHTMNLTPFLGDLELINHDAMIKLNSQIQKCSVTTSKEEMLIMVKSKHPDVEWKQQQGEMK